jgi:hypothetical protein
MVKSTRRLFLCSSLFDKENITFALLKALPHVTLVGNLLRAKFHRGVWNIWGRTKFFVDAINEQYYPVSNYEDQYMRWTTLRQERSQAVPEFTNTFHTLCTKLGIKDSERHLVLKYCGALHRYIQIEMDFLDISSLDVVYRYDVKIEQKFKHRNK